MSTKPGGPAVIAQPVAGAVETAGMTPDPVVIVAKPRGAMASQVRSTRPRADVIELLARRLHHRRQGEARPIASARGTP